MVKMANIKAEGIAAVAAQAGPGVSRVNVSRYNYMV